MTYKRFPPEGYINKALFYGLFLFFIPILSMRKSPSVHNLQAQGKCVKIWVIPKDCAWQPECSFCNNRAKYEVVSLDEFKFSYCVDHYKQAALDKQDI